MMVSNGSSVSSSSSSSSPPPYTGDYSSMPQLEKNSSEIGDVEGLKNQIDKLADNLRKRPVASSHTSNTSSLKARELRVHRYTRFAITALISFAVHPAAFLGGLAFGGVSAGVKFLLGRLKSFDPSTRETGLTNLVIPFACVISKTGFFIARRVSSLAGAMPITRLLFTTSSAAHGILLGHALVNYQLVNRHPDNPENH